MLNYILGKNIAFYIREHRGLVVISMLLATLASLFVVVPALLVQPIIDEGMKLGNDPVSWQIPWIEFDSGSWLSWRQTKRVIVDNVSPNRLLIILSFLIFISVLLKSVTEYFSELSATAFSNRAVRKLRIDLFNKFTSQPLEFHHKRKAGELVGRATADVDTLQKRIVHILVGLIKYPLSALVFLIYLFAKNYQMTLLIFLIGPIIIGLIRLFGRKLKKNSAKVQDAIAGVTSAFQESLICLKVIQSFCREPKEERKFKKLADNLYKRTMKWTRWDLGTSPAMDTAVFFILPAVLIFGKMYFEHTLGELMAMAYALSRVYGPVKKLAKVHNSIKTLQGATKRIFNIMNTPPAIQDKNNAEKLLRHQTSIEFRNVSFGYYPNELVLKNISLKINAGEMVAFVGTTGAGKSTLVDLIPRLYDVGQGNICIDDIDIRNVTLASLRGQIGIVNQETLLFHMTIAQNIGYGNDDFDMDKIIAAAKVANAHDFIMKQPNGYNTIVGDQGVLLSGGQRQRISIARAILINPAILILDEAASALDSESEKLVQKAIENLLGSRTILAVAHRLSTILKSDRIFVLEDGRIVESGNLQELLGINGRFRQLYDMQFQNNVDHAPL